MPVIQSPGQRINNMRVIEFPLWLRIVCYIIAIIFVLWILRSVYKYLYIRSLQLTEKNENAVLISKVKEAYREVKAYNTSLGSNRPAPGYGSTSNRGIAYRLYFDAMGKMLNLMQMRRHLTTLKKEIKEYQIIKAVSFIHLQRNRTSRRC